MARVEKWGSKFAATIDDMRRTPFAWGTNDCFVGILYRVTKAITGTGIGEEHLGKYDNTVTAYKYMKAQGFDSLDQYLASVLPEIHVSRAKIGDIAAIKDDSVFGYSLGAVNGERIFVFREDGLGTIDLLEADKVFEVA